jgi:hypothetical protein
MGRLNKRLGRAWLASAFGVVAHSIACAQQPAPATTPSVPATAASSPSSQGTAAVDIIPLRAFVGGVPLRNGNVVPNSELVELNGATLTPTNDYAIDYVAGVIYLKTPQQSGDTLTVNYRTTGKVASTAPGTGSPGFTGLNGFQYSFMPGAQAIFGLGMTDRSDDGSTTTSNLYGVHNSLKFGNGGSLSGVYVLADQQQSQSEGAFGSQTSRTSLQSANGSDNKFLVQNFRYALMGGSMSMDMQDISKDFSNFSSVRMSGYSDADVTRLKAERGLQRTGLSFTGLKFGAYNMNNSFKEVGDGRSKISWQSFGVQQKGFTFGYDAKKVDQTFTRFSDLSDSDKADLAKQLGTSRQNFASAFEQKAGKLSITSESIRDDIIHGGANKSDLAFSSKKYGFDFGHENVDQDFTRLGVLTKDESTEFSHEVGMKKQWLAFSAAPDSKSKPLTFNQLDYSNATGSFDERDAAFTGKTLSLQHIDMHSTVGYTGLSALQDADVTRQLAAIASNLGPTVKPAGNDKSSFLGAVGLNRDYTAANWQVNKNWGLAFNDTQLRGATDGGVVEAFGLTGKTLSAQFKSQNFGQNFTEATELMPMEQAQMGVLDGLKREDFNFSDQFNKFSKFTLSTLTAKTTSGEAGRTLFDYTNNGVEVSSVSRRVDPNFATVNQLVDPEAPLLGGMVGFSQSDLKWSLTRFKNFKFTGEAQDARDDTTGEVKGLHTSAFSWNLDKNTLFSYNSTEQVDKQPLQTILDSETEQFSLAHSFGWFGKFTYMREDDVNEGTTDTLPDATRDYIAYEAQISKLTSVKAEQTMTTWGNGQHEDVSAETVSTQLTKRAGVSLTEVQATGNEEGQDPAKHNYGVWYDLGNGVRISYGYAHQLQNGADSVSSNLTVGKNPTAPTSNQYGTLQPGAFGPLNFAGGYGTNQYTNVTGAANHTQAFSNVALATVKPLKFGPLTNIKFNFGMDTAADMGQWSKENHTGGFSADLSKIDFGYNYKSQLDTLGIEGIDRSFSLQTDQSPTSRIKASILYKVRTLPGDQNYLIRDYNVDARLSKNLDISNLLQTNPEVANTGVFLGSVPQAARSDKWTVNYRQGTNATFGLTYQEMVNEANDYQTTTAGLNLKLLEKTGSPITLFYGSEDDLGGNLPHRRNSRYTMEFDQHPGSHQTFSFLVGNVSYDYSPTPGFNKDNWTARLDYTLHF